MKIRPIIGGVRTLSLLFYLKLFHGAKGWKYFFGSWKVFRVDQGKIYLQSGIWIEEGTLCHCISGNISIGQRTFINRLVTIACREKITIGNDVLIGDNVAIHDHDHRINQPHILFSKQGYICDAIIICDNVWIGSHSVILKGVTVGQGAVVAAGSVVTKSIPSREVWGGVPAKFIRTLK